MSCTSGGSCFATLRTRTNDRLRVPPTDTVAVAAPSNAYGTSVPGVFRPSLRRYATWYLVIVTSLFVVGADGVPAVVTFFGARRRSARPPSAKIVGQGE